MKSAKSAKQATDYPYIRAWGRLMGSLNWYTQAEVAAARAANAPETAIYRRSANDATQPDIWYTLEDILVIGTKAKVEHFADEIRGGK